MKLLDPVLSFFIDIDAPLFLWILSGVLILFALGYGFYLWYQIRKLCSPSQTLSGKLRKDARNHRAGRGISLSQLEDIGKLFAESQLCASVWKRIEKKIVIREQHDADEYWLSASPAEALNPYSVYSKHINRGFYESVPGILTGLGLLFTFVAILFALMNVSVKDAGRIAGMEQLIGGLSGKFITSIVALFCATAFTVFEKNRFHHLNKTIQDLLDSVCDVIPVLSTTHLLAELQRDIGEQSVAFRSFNTDLSVKLKQSFGESINPTIQRMVDAVENLNKHLSATEASKNDTIVDNLSGILSTLESSITQALSKMGEQFSSSLSGSAMTQFSRLTESLAGAASVLEQMNQQNQITQSAMSELVTFAKNSTAEQLALGKNQIEDLTNVLRSMLAQIEQATGASVDSMGVAISAMMSDLKETTTGFITAASQFNSLLPKLGEITTGAEMCTTDLSVAVRSVKDSQEALQLVTRLTSDNVEKLTLSNREQQDQFARIPQTMQQYERTFSNVEESASALLTTLEVNLDKHLQLYQRGYESLAKVSDEHFVNATQRLGQTVNELEEFLSDLAEIFEKAKSLAEANERAGNGN